MHPTPAYFMDQEGEAQTGHLAQKEWWPLLTLYRAAEEAVVKNVSSWIRTNFGYVI